MPTESELTQALIAADRAGNTADAQMLAAALRQMRVDNPNDLAPPPVGVEPGFVRPEPETPMSIGRDAVMGAVGAYEVLGSALLGSIQEVISGGAGIFDLAAETVSGSDDPLTGAAETISKARDIFPDYNPQTEQGQMFMEAMAGPLQQYADFAEARGNLVLEKQESPMAATVEQMTWEMAPGLVGLRNPASIKAPNAIRDLRQRSTDVSRETELAEGIGVNLKDGIEQQGAQVIQSVQDLAAQTSKGGNLEGVQNAIMAARQKSKDQVRQLYDAAKEGEATFPSSAAKQFASDAIESVSDFDIADMPRLKARVQELESIANLPDNAALKLNALARFRRKINRKAPVNDVEQNAALGILKGQVDDFMQNLFDADMLSGDKMAISRWRTANQAYRQHAQTFNADRTIRNLAENQATPEQLTNWIFGSSSVGAKAQSGAVVQRIKDIVGENSPEFNALRQQVVYDVMEPLLKETPNFKQFVNKYNQFVSRNPTLAKELFPDSYDQLGRLKRQSEALLKTGGSKINFDLNQAAARALFGHGIAKAGLRVQIARNIIDLMRRTAEGSDKRKIMSELVGYDVGKPVIPVNTVTFTGLVPGMTNDEEAE